LEVADACATLEVVERLDVVRGQLALGRRAKRSRREIEHRGGQVSEFFEIFNPGARYQRQQRDLDKTYVMQYKKGGRGPLGIDLDAGTMVIKPRESSVPDEPQAEPDSSRETPETD
jgi:hypothetical protein